MDPQAFWDEIVFQALFEEIPVVVGLDELVGEPVVALPQLEKSGRAVSGSCRGGYRAGNSGRVMVFRVRSARLRLDRRIAPDAIG